MFFVPVVPSSPPPPPSPRTRELAALLTRVLEEYRKTHPSVSGRELRDALTAARASLGPLRGGSAVVRMKLAAALLAAGLGVGVAVFARTGGFDLSGAAPVVFINLAVIFLLAVIVLLRVSR